MHRNVDGPFFKAASLPATHANRVEAMITEPNSIKPPLPSENALLGVGGIKEGGESNSGR